MDNAPRKLEIFPNYFEVAKPSEECLQSSNSIVSQSRTGNSLRSRSRVKTPRRFMSAASMMRLFSLRGLSWPSSTDGDDKVEMTTAEVESLRSEIADLEERESYLKAQLEHLDEILRSALLAGYLHLRTRWTELPGEPPVIDDIEVDDWLPRFVVLNGSCIFYYLKSTDLSPQDSTLLSDVVEVGSLASFTREDQQTWHAFYVLTSQGLRFECASPSKTQLESWLTTLQTDCNLGSARAPTDK